jgi:hypothetical protein
MKKRVLDASTRVENSKYYADPIEAMALYLNQTSDQITRLDYLGAMYDVVQAGQEDAIYTPEEIAGMDGGQPKRTRKLGAFGRAIQEETEASRLDDAKVDEIHKMLGARFQKKAPMFEFLRGAKTLTHLAFLGSPTTAITQLGDYAYSFYKNGINETLSAFKKPIWRLEDVYQIGNDIAWEFTDSQRVPDRMQKVLDSVLSITGMRAMDAKAKGTFLTGTANRWGKILNGRSSKAKSKLIQRIQANQGIEKAGQTIKDIKAGRKTDGVAEMLLYELGEIAPMTQSDMPQLYNQYPNVRILYALKSYTIKQFNFARNQSAKKIVSGDPKQVKEGMKNMMKLSAALALANIPADIIKDFITGDDMRLDIDDVLIDNLWRLLGLSRYTQVIAERQGVGSALENLTYKPPLVNVVNAVGKDVLNFAPPIISDESKSLQYVPVIGKLLYKWQKNYGD